MLCLYSHKYESQNPRMMSKGAAVRSKKLKTEDPLVVQLVKDGGEDTKYVEMLNAVKNDITNLREDCELKRLAGESCHFILRSQVDN